MRHEDALEQRYRERNSRRWLARLRRLLEPPLPVFLNPAEPTDFPLGRWNLYIGGAGRAVDGYVNLDLLAIPGVDVAADAEHLPFPAGIFTRVECDAVLNTSPMPARCSAKSSASPRPAATFTWSRRSAIPFTSTRAITGASRWTG